MMLLTVIGRALWLAGEGLCRLGIVAIMGWPKTGRQLRREAQERYDARQNERLQIGQK